MNIAIIASDSKKDLVSRFCSAYQGVLKNHNIFCTDHTGQYIQKTTKLKTTNFLSGKQGGFQQLISKISFNEIDLVIYINDFLTNNINNDSAKFDLNRICDIYSIPIATNIATAEALILGLSRGDLNWRISVNPSLKNTN